MPEMVQIQAEKPLVVADPNKVREDLDLVDPEKIQVDESDPELVKQAEEYATKLVTINPKDLRGREDRRMAVENAGRKLQLDFMNNAMLKEQVRVLAKKGADGGDVANALVDLKIQVEELDPHKWDFGPGWLSRLMGRTPVAGKALKRYFTKYESAQTVIGAIVASLEKGKFELIRDNKTLKDEQIKMRELTLKLEKLIKLLQLVDKNLAGKIQAETDEEKKKFFQEELLFTLRQTVMDRLQQLAVNQQGILVYEIIIRNNRELVRGVDRANTVTINALNVAVTAAFALAKQRIVLDKIIGVNKTTSDLIAKNAELLKTQGVEIHKQASEAMLDMDKLKSAFADIHAAMKDVERFRIEALDRMGRTISELDQMTVEAEKSIKKMEQGNQVRPSLQIEVE
ncbi:MAG: Toxic anion resistance family protein [Parcubacteria group bacterium GW2011_GWA2_42_14]|nr:MAG: Toxic anion resistance family protein [Parcubacteria group bacterium GW2011_GWA2_42_14]